MSEGVSVAITHARTAVLMEHRDLLAGQFREACDELAVFKASGRRGSTRDARDLRRILRKKAAAEESLRAANRELRAVELESEAATWRAFMAVAQRRLSSELFDQMMTEARQPGAVIRIHRRGRPRIPVGTTTPHQET